MEYRLGIDLGGTTFKIGLVDSRFQMIRRASAPTDPLARSFDAVVADMAGLAKRVIADAGLDVHALSAAGIGTPGCINPQTGEVLHAGNLNWRRAPLARALSQRLGLPVRIANDANCAIIGETLAGAAKGKKNALILTLGTGVGGGIILDGKLFTGGNAMGAEFGHTPFVFDGLRCSCGLRGCLEVYASATALIRMTREAMARCPDSTLHTYAAREGGAVTGRTAFDCARAGDPAAAGVVDAYTTYVAAGLGGFISMFRPDIVLLGGGVSQAGAALIEPVNRKLPDYAFAHKLVPLPPVVAAMLGNDAGIIGAAFLDTME